MMLIEIPEYFFVHGACLYDGGMVNVLYFSDIQTGLIVSAAERIGESKLMRFSAKMMPPEFESRN